MFSGICYTPVLKVLCTHSTTYCSSLPHSISNLNVFKWSSSVCSKTVNVQLIEGDMLVLAIYSFKALFDTGSVIWRMWAFCLADVSLFILLVFITLHNINLNGVSKKLLMSSAIPITSMKKTQKCRWKDAY